MRQIASLILIVVMGLSGYADTGTLKGVVKDSKTGSPVSKAIVRMLGKDLTDTTDATGNFTFSFTTAILRGYAAPFSFLKPQYLPNRGIVFVNKEQGVVRVEIFNPNGKLVAHLNHSVLSQGIWALPVKNIARGMYLCKIKSPQGVMGFQFFVTETSRQGIAPAKLDNIQGLQGLQLSKQAASAPVDTVITSKGGYFSDTLQWEEKLADSVTITLQDTATPVIPVGAAVRTIIPFDDKWLFYNKGAASGADQVSFADASWQSVNVPHDWGIEGPYNKDEVTNGRGGYLPAGLGWYRKHFTLPANLAGGRIFIEFDGVMANSTVYVNGTSVGNRPFGYMQFRYDITSQVKTGSTENVIAVKADNSLQPAARWYTGSGIYRHVRIIATNQVHFDKWSTIVTTPTTASVNIKTTVLNQGTASQNVTVQAVLVDPSGTKLSPVSSPAKSIAAGGTADFSIDVPVANAKLWSPETPNMYSLIATVQSGTTSLDDEVTPFGIRTMVFDVDKGFMLNGKSTKFKGVCLHHDMSGLGAAVPLRAMQRRLATLKSLGVNAIRTSHNPFDPQVYDLFDKMGFLVMDEFFDTWVGHKYDQKGDYAAYFNTWYKTDLTDIVKQHRNHPGIALYSIGNEIRDGLSTRTPLAQTMVKMCHDLDPTRSVTQALFQPSSNKDYPNATEKILDVFGANYRPAEVAEACALTPHHAGVVTEAGAKPGDWASVYMANPQITGVFIWTGADYLGEADGLWPIVGGDFGLIDRVGTIKSDGYNYQKVWATSTTSAPKTTSGSGTKIVLTVDHPTITTDNNDVAYVKAMVTDASGAIATGASNTITFAVTGTAGEIKAVDSGTLIGEPYRGNSRKAFAGVCYAIVQMKTAGSITIAASASGLTGATATVTGTNGSFVPCSGNCD